MRRPLDAVRFSSLILSGETDEQSSRTDEQLYEAGAKGMGSGMGVGDEVRAALRGSRPVRSEDPCAETRVPVTTLAKVATGRWIGWHS
jgi:hypothetical protein